MKKRMKKLTLNRETLRRLDSAETKLVAGGYPSECNGDSHADECLRNETEGLDFSLNNCC